MNETIDTFEKRMNYVCQVKNDITKLKKSDKIPTLEHIGSKKLLPRERIACLIDPGSPFLEFSPLAGFNMYDKKVHSGGIITGIGKIHNKLAMIICNDPTVKAGSYYPITIKKELRAQQIALDNKLPCIYLVDSGGANLDLQDEVFPDVDDFGGIFYNMANLSNRGIRQIAIVLGPSIAGGAYQPGMCDVNIISKPRGYVALAGSALVEAATGEHTEPSELGGADLHCKESGVCDQYAINEIDAITQARIQMKHLNINDVDFEKIVNCKKPRYDMKDVYGLLSSDLKQPFDIKQIIARIVDDSEFDEFKPLYGPSIVTGWGNIYGQTVGIIGNNGVIFTESAHKVYIYFILFFIFIFWQIDHFINLCNQDSVPLLFLHNVSGFMVGKKYERQGINKAGSNVLKSLVSSTNSKISLLIGGSYGAGNYGMCGRSFKPNFLYTWPSSRIAVMGAEQAANAMAGVKRRKYGNSIYIFNIIWLIEWSLEDDQKYVAEKLNSFNEQSDPYYASARLWDDGIIHPLQTREILGMSYIFILLIITIDF